MIITAMKQALEALEWSAKEINEWRDDAYGYDPKEYPEISNAITALRQAIEQAEQAEPVLWQWKDTEIVSPYPKTGTEGWRPLYTHPARELRPHSDAYICRITKPFDARQLVAIGIARAIEAAHGIGEKK